MRALAGETPVVGGTIRRHHPLAMPEYMGYVSFETHRQLIAREQAADAARYFSGDIESYLTPEGLMEIAGKAGKQAKRRNAWRHYLHARDRRPAGPANTLSFNR